MDELYDRIGTGYTTTRKADSRLVDRIVEVLNLPVGSRILDVGAGTGSYSYALSDRGLNVTALEPSSVMIEQASKECDVTWVQGSAELLPFSDNSFDGAIFILCIHHFDDLIKAFSEIRRVNPAGPVVIFTYDPRAVNDPWLFQYFPDFKDQIRRTFPAVEWIESQFSSDVLSVNAFPLPHDIQDGFAGAGWRTPEKYLDQEFRAGTSAFRLLDTEVAEQGLTLLASDLDTGEWDSRFGKIRLEDDYDHGYLFITAKSK